MTLNENSTSANFYRWFYSTENLPDNLCPYFWKLVAASLLSIPYLILVYPCQRIKTLGSFVKWVLAVIGVVIVLAFLVAFLWWNYHLIRCMLGCYSYNSTAANLAIGYDLWFLFLFTAPRIYKLIKNKFQKKKEKRQYMAVEYVKAVYGRYCPKIDWTKQETV